MPPAVEGTCRCTPSKQLPVKRPSTAVTAWHAAGDEEVQYVFLEFKHPEGDTQLIPGTELVLKVGSCPCNENRRVCGGWASTAPLLMHAELLNEMHLLPGHVHAAHHCPLCC